MRVGDENEPCTRMPGAAGLAGAPLWLIHGIKTDALTILLLIALSTVSWLPRLTGPIDLRWDGSVYYILGTSLADGKGYRLLNEPGEIEAVQYPPLLPVIVAMHQWLLGTTDPIPVGQWLRLSFFVVFVGYILSTHSMFKIFLPRKYAFVGALLCLLNLHTYLMSDLLFPEIPFALCTILFMLWHLKTANQINLTLTAVFAIASYALRSIGICLFAAWIAESLFKRDFKKALSRLTVGLITVISWQTYIFFVQSGTSYNQPAYEYQRADYLFYNVTYSKNIFSLKNPFVPELGHASLQDIAARFIQNLIGMPISLAEAVSSTIKLWELPWKSFNMPFPLSTPWPVYLILAILGFLVIGGLGLQIARRQFIIPLYVFLTLSALCLTPWPEQFNRYLMPIAPFLVLSLLTTLLAIQDRCRESLPMRWKATSVFATSSLLTIILLHQSLTLFATYTRWHPYVVYSDKNNNIAGHRLLFYENPYRALDAGLDWLKLRARSRDVVAVSMPHWVYLRTGLKSVMPPFEANPVEAQKLLDSVPVDYLIIDEGLAVDTEKYTLAVIQNFPNLWKLVYSSPFVAESGNRRSRFEIYQRIFSDLSISETKIDADS